MNRDVMHYTRLYFTEEKYSLYLCTDWGDHTGVARHYTDETLPDEIKTKLGMALFGIRPNGVGDIISERGQELRRVDIWITTKTYRQIRGETKRDPRRKSQKQG